MKSFKNPGLIGLSIALTTNLIGHYIFHRPSSEFFSSMWWTAWFPNYLIWMAFLFGGIARRNRPEKFR
jgi:hypothetical protein